MCSKDLYEQCVLQESSEDKDGNDYLIKCERCGKYYSNKPGFRDPSTCPH